ncbi:hypothetical protein MP478_08140 [Chryseobacterium sp. WG14]|uniref:hypothetical protein n=1 Tax=Chryseobacterium sp. WG14 TaxID=2926909 RepID=UPI00211F1FE9|nr:hypothetical protein [Chryseobacterium sp. WG14]MCQ9639362.1 hypothetical protein [Chryseobacterium sp. WG14]
MNYKYTLVCLLLLLGLIYCTSSKKPINKQDLRKIELLLSKHKKYAFIDLYRKEIQQEEKKYHIKKCDSLFDLSSTELVQENCLFMDFYSEDHSSYIDQNYQSMINKWLKKDYPPSIPADNPNIKMTMTFKKALDFYESADLDKYIDSLRVVCHRKYKENKLESINCIN